MASSRRKSTTGNLSPRLDRAYGTCRGCGHGATHYEVVGQVAWFICKPCSRTWPRLKRFADALAGCTIDGELRYRKPVLASLREYRAVLDTYIQALEAAT